MQFFSPAQCVGYVAFVLGALAFSQKSDRRLKILNGLQSLVYAVHFMLLGNLPASASSTTSGIRNFVALKTRSPYVAALIIAVNVALGFIFAKSSLGWLPVIASCGGTIAILTMRGIPMRLLLLVCTLLWLVNNVVSGSIGGTLLECTIATSNVATMFRLLRSRSKSTLVDAECSSALLK
jgi:hypothetical protein